MLAVESRLAPCEHDEAISGSQQDCSLGADFGACGQTALFLYRPPWYTRQSQSTAKHRASPPDASEHTPQRHRLRLLLNLDAAVSSARGTLCAARGCTRVVGGLAVDPRFVSSWLLASA